jgi:hypothetical protein
MDSELVAPVPAAATINNKLELKLISVDCERSPAIFFVMTMINSICYRFTLRCKNQRVCVSLGVALRVEFDLVAIGIGNLDARRLLVRVVAVAVRVRGLV